MVIIVIRSSLSQGYKCHKVINIIQLNCHKIIIVTRSSLSQDHRCHKADHYYELTFCTKIIIVIRSSLSQNQHCIDYSQSLPSFNSLSLNTFDVVVLISSLPPQQIMNFLVNSEFVQPKLWTDD